MNCEVYFIWRNLVATYNLNSREFTFEQDNMYIVPWKDYPEDMEKFINWIMECQQHADGIIWTDYGTGEKRYPKPKTIEVC